MTGLLRWAFAGLLVALAVGLASAVMQIPEAGSALRDQVMTQLPETGVDHAVTAVLLNYRGYDTFLELVVLLLALLGAWGLSDSMDEAPQDTTVPVLKELIAFLVPVLIVVAAYLLWVGAYSPGGAFQGGAVLAGAGVLLSLSDPGWRGRRVEGIGELLLVPGILVFLLVGLLSMLWGGQFLEYPRELAGSLILLVEGFAMLSIAVTLHTLFAGTPRTGSDP
ncbi:MAG: Na(+)/H(+) antiporter subunit B [Chromatocurvus sp.]